MEQGLVRGILGEVIRGVICQRLVPFAHGPGRRVVCEVAEPTGRVRDAIRDPAALSGLLQVLAEGEFRGMQTLEQDAVRLVLSGDISLHSAESVVVNVADLHLVLRRAGFAVEQLSSAHGVAATNEAA